MFSKQQDTLTTIRPWFHGLSAAFIGYTLYYDFYKGGVAPIPNNILSKMVWLTLVDMYLQLIYHTAAAFASFKKPTSLLARGVDFAFTSLAVPIALGVVGLFWGLHFVNPDLLLNEEAKKVLSVAWYNHALHTFPGVAMLIDMFITKHRRPNRYAAFATIAVFSICYLSFVLYIHSVTGFWAYPVLGDLGLAGRTAFIIGCALFIYTLFVLGDWLNGKTWSEKSTRSTRAHAPAAALKNRKPKKA